MVTQCMYVMVVWLDGASSVLKPVLCFVSDNNCCFSMKYLETGDMYLICNNQAATEHWRKGQHPHCRCRTQLAPSLCMPIRPTQTSPHMVSFIETGSMNILVSGSIFLLPLYNGMVWSQQFKSQLRPLYSFRENCKNRKTQPWWLSEIMNIKFK